MAGADVIVGIVYEVHPGQWHVLSDVSVVFFARNRQFPPPFSVVHALACHLAMSEANKADDDKSDDNEEYNPAGNGDDVQLSTDKTLDFMKETF